MWSQIIHHQESMGFYKFFIVQSTLSEPVSKKEKMHKNYTHHHVVIGAANTAAPIISIFFFCLHQYIGAARTVAPIYWCD
jgi:hypothetical protein